MFLRVFLLLDNAKSTAFAFGAWLIFLENYGVET
jgi:hypothetical protein